ncbi:unhealthy ribosome biogenesis protein 2 homolog [Saccostrea echinata]|uniref:unhealthy ribosome biogenesis protein 2 homolog n=1 Tax=Saccostrea echinata TaxID=191078 RepID=UPI002A81774A|nr:unhealthy ribosome biogenesis protein 2 homolog [Saccostrea echinata]
MPQCMMEPKTSFSEFTPFLEFFSPGIYTRLKDRTSDIKSRLKLTKFAWLSDKVIFPNKEQVLIDFLGGLLLNRKRSNITEDETFLVWRCLFEVLQTRKCHTPAKFRHTLIIKPSISQVLCDSILLEYEKNSGCTADIVGCALAIIQSPTLSYVFTSKYDFLVKFLGNVLLLTVRTIQDGRPVHSDLIQLLQKCTATYSVSQRSQPQQTKVFQSVVERLLIPTLLLGSLTEKCHELKNCVENLNDILDQALFHREHHPFYESFLSAIVGKDERKQKVSKTIESLFHLLSNLINKKKGQDNYTDTQKIISHYLVAFFDHFLSHKCHGEKTQTGFRLFVHICHIIGIRESSLELCGPLSQEEVVIVLSPLLRSLLKHEIYSQPQDTSDGNIQLKFYNHILIHVLEGKQSSLFYACLESFLELNHAILETKMSEVFRIGWFEVLNRDLMTYLDGFLIKLLQTYSKLRQVPKLLSLLLTSVRDMEFTQDPVFSEATSLHFGEVVEHLPQGVVTEVWGLFLKEIPALLLRLQTEDTSSACKLLFVTKLFAVFLSHVKVADYTITHLTRLKVKGLMEETQSGIIAPLIERVADRKLSTPEPVLFSALLLSYFWGELHFLLEAFNVGDQRSECHEQNIYRNLEVIFTIDSKSWKKVHTIVTDAGVKRNSYLWKLLTTLVLKAMLADKSIELPKDIMRILLKLFSDIEKCLSGKACLALGMLWEISEENYSPASLDLVLKMLPLCGSRLSCDTTQQITDLVMRVMTNVIDVECQQILGSHFLERCSHSDILESSSWSSCMLTATFKTVRLTIREKQKNSNKKMKTDSKLSTISTVLDELCDDVFTTASEYSKRMEKLQFISHLISDRLLNVHGERQLTTDKSSWIICLQHIEILTQCDHSPEEMVRGFLGVLTQLTAIMAQKQTEDEELLGRILSVMIKTIEKVARAPLFHMINVEKFLNWCSCLLAQEKQIYSQAICQKLELLLELSCRVMVTDFQLLPELFHIMNKGLQGSPVTVVPCSVVLFLKEISQLLKRSYLKEDVIGVCQTGVLEIYRYLKTHLDKLQESSEKLTVGHVWSLSALVQILPREQIDSNNVTFILNFSLKILEDLQGDLCLTGACLEYIQSLCLSLDPDVKLLSCEQKLTLWTTLKTVFKHMLMQNGQKTSIKGESQSLKCLVASILKSKEPDRKFDYFTDFPMEWTSQDEEKQQSWAWMRKKMMFDGCFERDGWRLIFQQIQSTIGALIFCVDADQFQTIIDTLVLDCHLEELVQHNFYKMFASVHLWKQVIQNELTEEKGAIVVQAVEKVMIHFQSAMLQLKDIQDDHVILSLAVPIMKCQADMLNFGPSLMSSQCATLALQSCAYIPLCTSSHYPAFNAVCAVLTSMMVHHTEAALSVIPTFISCANRLMKFVIAMGNQEILIETNTATEARNCAHNLNKLYVLIASHKLDFSKVAVYLVSNFVSEVQKMTLLPTVKRALMPAIYAILDICDNHVISQLHMVLNQGVKAVFKVLYSDYMKYHHYTGKV